MDDTIKREIMSNTAMLCVKTRAQACAIIIKRMKQPAISRDREFMEALKWAWLSLLGPEAPAEKALKK